MREITEIIIHCSASPNGRNDTAEDIHRWHISRNFSGNGYHYIIQSDGVLAQGRPEYWIGAHARGHNTESLGICLIGTNEFAKSQWWMLKDLILKLKVKYPKAKILGHNEISNKTCPGFNVQDWLSRESMQ